MGGSGGHGTRLKKPKRTPRDRQDDPRGLEDSPRALKTPQDRLTLAQEAPKTPQEGSCVAGSSHFGSSDSQARSCGPIYPPSLCTDFRHIFRGAMAALSPSATPLTKCDEIASTDFDEERRIQLRDPPVRTRCVWKVAVPLAIVMGLLSVATTGWTRPRTVGDGVTSLERDEEIEVATPGAFLQSPRLGCSNWNVIEIARKEVADRAECEDLCNTTSTCTTYNWQETTCASRRSWKAKGCLLFKGDCAFEDNDCFQLGTPAPARCARMSKSLKNCHEPSVS